MKYTLETSSVEAMIKHWLNTKANSYRGSSYGEANNRILLLRMSEDSADQILNKIRNDIPLLQNLNSDELSIYSENIGHDKKRILLVVGGVEVDIGETGGDSNYTGEFINANAQ